MRRHRLTDRTRGLQSLNRSSTLRGGTMHPKYQKAIKLRKKGESYREIAKALNVSKNSVSRWCKNLKLPLFAQKILEKKSNYPKELFREYNRLKVVNTRVAPVYLCP